MRATLKTKRLILRPWKIDDAESFFYGWATDSEVPKYLTWNVHKNIEETRDLLNLWIKQYEKQERINFAIELKDTHELIGGIDVAGYIDGVPVIGYTLKRDKWNQGYMTEACKCVRDFLFSLGYNTIKIDAVVENIGSNRVIQKCGGILLGNEEQEFPNKGKVFRINNYIFKR